MVDDTDLKLRKLLASYIFTILTTLQTLIILIKTSTIQSSAFIRFSNLLLHFYFHYCGLSPYTIDLNDGQSTINLYTSTHRRRSKPNLIILHGFGGDSRWQFYPLIASLSSSFNLYIPDLLFFGDSFTLDSDRSVQYQARCVMEAIRNGLGVEKCTVFAISYGGWVAYKMAEIYPEVVDKIVIVSSGVGYTEEQRKEHLMSLGVKIQDLLIPETASELRRLVQMVSYKQNRFKWVPDFFLQQFVHVINEKYKEQRRELVEHMLNQKADSENLPVLKQKTLLIWGDKDKIFPLYLGYQLQRHLSPNAKLEIIKDCGHAVNMDAPVQLTHLIKSFVLAS